MDSVGNRQGSKVESLLGMMKESIYDLYQGTAHFEHSDAASNKIILPILLNLSEYCHKLESIVAKNEITVDYEVKNVSNILLNRYAAYVIDAVNEKINYMIAQSTSLRTAMFVLIDQLNISSSNNVFQDIENFCSTRNNSYIPPSSKSQNDLPQNITENETHSCISEDFTPKLQKLTQNVEKLGDEIESCYTLSIHITSKFDPSLINNYFHIPDCGKVSVKGSPKKLYTKLPTLSTSFRVPVMRISEIENEKCSFSTDHNDKKEFCFKSEKFCEALQSSKGRNKTETLQKLSSILDVPKYNENSEKRLEGIKSVHWGRDKSHIIDTSMAYGKVYDILCKNDHHQYVTKCLQDSVSIGHTSHFESLYFLPKRYCPIEFGHYSSFDKQYISNVQCLEGHSVLGLNFLCNFQSGHNDSTTVISETSGSNVSTYLNSLFIAQIIKHLVNEKICSDSKKAKLVAVIQELKCAKKELEMKVAQLQKQYMDALTNKEEFRKRADYIISKERKEFYQQISRLHDERDALVKNVSQLKFEVSSLEKELVQIKNELLVGKVTHEEDVATLHYWLQSETLRFEKALKNYEGYDNTISEMKAKIAHQEEIICTLESGFDLMKTEMTSERENRLFELEELTISLNTRDAECSALNEDLKRCISELDEECQQNIALTSQLCELKASTHNTLSAMEAELNLLKSDSHVLRKKLVKLLREKDMLWKRTDHLTHLQKSQIAGRWMSDHEVTHCTGCKHRFSFILRKHHCRLCGKIFCHSCANNWLLTAASRCQSRVCNDCFVQHMQLKKVMKDGNSVYDICNDSEDEEIAENTSCVSSQYDPSTISCPSSILSVGLDSSGVNDLSDMSQEENSYHLNVVPKRTPPSDIERNCNFDVITDEEIAKSLSTSSPYNPVLVDSMLHDSQTDYGMSLTLSRTITEIEASGEDGISGEIWVSAGTRSGIPVLCDTFPADLHWKFTCDKKAMAFNVLSKENDTMKVISSHSTLKSEGNLMLHHSGLYILQFDNTFSRIKARKVQYTLWVKSPLLSVLKV